MFWQDETVQLGSVQPNPPRHPLHWLYLYNMYKAFADQLVQFRELGTYYWTFTLTHSVISVEYEPQFMHWHKKYNLKFTQTKLDRHKEEI
jgi:hypothetical protein